MNGTKTSKFVCEVLVDGALWHRLECGHTHAAQNDPDNAMLPVEMQTCWDCTVASSVKESN